jgi:SAM-dependent methyltransferase
MSGLMLRLKRIGPRSLVLCAGKRIYFRILARRYRFSNWHASAPYECRPYKAEVVALANTVDPAVVLEIGCGLGEIISRVNCDSRYGVDLDAAVLEGARFLHGNACRFAVGSLSDGDALFQFVRDRVDLLILVNWPHRLSWPDLSSAVEKVIHGLGARYVLIDGIRPEVTGYANYHGRTRFEAWGEIACEKISSDGARVLYLVRCGNGPGRVE